MCGEVEAFSLDRGSNQLLGSFKDWSSNPSALSERSVFDHRHIRVVQVSITTFAPFEAVSISVLIISICVVFKIRQCSSKEM